MKSRIRMVEAVRACKWDLMAAGTVLFAQEEKPFGAGDESSAWTGDVYISTNGWMDGWMTRNTRRRDGALSHISPYEFEWTGSSACLIPARPAAVVRLRRRPPVRPAHARASSTTRDASGLRRLHVDAEPCMQRSATVKLCIVAIALLMKEYAYR
jgi:hypothetical protein